MSGGASGITNSSDNRQVNPRKCQKCATLTAENAALKQQLAERLEWNKTAVESCGIASGEIAALRQRCEAQGLLLEGLRELLHLLVRSGSVREKIVLPWTTKIDAALSTPSGEVAGVDVPKVVSCNRCRNLS